MYPVCLSIDRAAHAKRVQEKFVEGNLPENLFHEIRINHKVRCNVPDGAGRLDGAHIGESVYYVGPDTDCKITGYFVDPVILPDHQYFYFSGVLFILILNVAGFYILNKNLLKKSAEMQRIIPKERKDIYQIANQVDFIKQNEDNTNLNDILEKHLEIIEQENKRVNVYARGMSEVTIFLTCRPKHYFDSWYFICICRGIQN